MIKVISTVGTSLFDNYLKEKDNPLIRTLAGKPHSAWAGLSERADRIKKLFTPGIINSSASAEIKSVLKIRETLGEQETEIHLIASDTVESRLAAEIIAEVLQQQYGMPVSFAPEKDVIIGLQVHQPRLFETEGVSNLIKRFEELAGGYYANVVLNITGGYKGLIPHLTIMAQINSVPVYYLFEHTEKLIRIPQTPLDINWGLFEKYREVFSQLAEGVEKSWQQYQREQNIGEDFQWCIEEIEAHGQPLIALNAVGRIFWHRYNRFFYVYVPAGGKYFTESPDKKRFLHQAFYELHRRLGLLPSPLETLTDKDIKHCCISDTYVFKFTNPQLRLQYKVMPDGRLVVYNYYFINSSQVDNSYARKMAAEYPGLAASELTALTFS
ncbi:putative CRISPR-associated protein [Dethiobacter alkaliphilus]|uniref:putative CRISPR-associated protein n=1 Tax=Dethiobacter alkaliphilus TaxID=427926 RepID=UPI00222666A4|nr:putative CRISPR-associated protein [Dethiobacter alkaliphilus]MCW3488685.1 putative CRISPR-associated protein [Dethiobacter alkaliphilus]